MTEHIEQLRQVIVEHGFNADLHPDHILAATYPPACQTCDGTGRVDGPGTAYVVKTRAPCPDCPTIAQLLAWGVAVATAEIEMGLVEWGDQSWLYADRLLDAIRAVKP